jgi:hypothetical protein
MKIKGRFYMLLKREDVQYRRVMRGGNEILRVRYQSAAGDCQAALHTAALVERLVEYAEGALAERLVDEGILDRTPFRRYRYEIDWRAEIVSRGLVVTLTALLAQGREVLDARTLVTCWDESGQWQKKSRSVDTAGISH